MGKLIDRPIAVNYNAEKGPVSICFDGNVLRVAEILEIWKDTGAWWDGEGEKTFFRIQTENQGLWEIYRENTEWYLYKIYD
ncbi:hypothetical protein Tfer_2049 [Thermincola ferriacetica]|uniref:DUF6504 domain-containing protein n=1 Tax=Thermincola ferriacetica TaxID=281456 RepID=A0A0L6W1H7_9FIRM|nr:DUF6504 family protein [Thermincola ferriacetica]KNZ69253.1 hypothetical protein Tfer_2049 [Thermincola ferriacetica]